jgi:hypothetical protein
MTRFAALALLLAAAPAFADEATLGEGLSLCLTRMSDPVGATEAVVAAGWTPGPVADSAAEYRKGAVALYLASDATACTVVADDVATARVEVPLIAAMDAAGVSGVRFFETEMGCRAFELADGRIVTWTGAEPDPDCDSPASSATTIYLPGG